MSAPVAWVPLDRAAMCLSCEAVFALTNQCPRCAGRAFVMLARWVKSMEAAAR